MRTFVIHDWGSALGFDWANRHREARPRCDCGATTVWSSAGPPNLGIPWDRHHVVDFTLVREGTNSQAIVEDLPLSVSRPITELDVPAEISA